MNIPMNRAVFPAMQRAWSLVTAGLRIETTNGSQSHAGEPPSTVAALCMCVLGDDEGGASDAWPPRSVAELRGRSDGTETGAAQDAGLLEQGFDALDELSVCETGARFARLDRRAQLRSLFQLEAGRGRLSRRHAGAFMDAFLSLAAEAYLRDALSVMPGRQGDRSAQRAPRQQGRTE